MKILTSAAIAMALILAGLAGSAAWLGYLGGELFVPVPATAPARAGRGQLSAVILSGDMGFKVGKGPKLAEYLAGDGIATLGVNSLVYFRHHRTKAEIDAFIANVVRRGVAYGHGRRLILIGQSFGADILQTGLAALPPDLRRHLAMVALFVPGDTVDYQTSPAEMLDLIEPDASALPTGRQLTWIPTLCVRGREETDSLCPHLTAPNVQKIVLPGGHRLNHDTELLYRQLITAIDRRATNVSP